MATHDAPVATDFHERPGELLRELIQFETVNPPGNERACIEWIGDLLSAYGVEYETYARDPDRPNLLARLPGGDALPLLLYGHVDVVPVDEDEWSHDPFAGVADDGMGFLVEEHPELFADVEYALGEFGGFTFEIGGVEAYPIQVNEKQVCWMEATFRGTSGHASLPTADTAMGKMAEFVRTVDGERLPVHVTPAVESMVEALAYELERMTDGHSGKQRKHLLEAKEDAEFALQSPLGRIVDEFHEEFGESLRSEE